MKIAIVTFELEGLTRNGGIGTAFRRLAELLAANGHSVTVFFMPFGGTFLTAKAELEMKNLARRNIKVIRPEIVGPKIYATFEPYHTGRSYLIYEMLKNENFDVVHSSDNAGLVYFSLLAKRCRLAFAQTRFVIGTHGCLKWVAEANGVFSSDSVLVGELDHLSIEMADHVVSPSAYMLNYREAKGWTLPADSRVIGNVNSLDRFKPSKKARGSKIVPQKTLVFFGRIERRKGIFVFIKAIEKLLHETPKLGRKSPLKVILLGSSPDISVQTAVDDALARLRHFGRRLKITKISDLSSEESLAYLAKDPHHLVCMPSLIDNFPYVIVEAVERRLDFIASNSGGQSEIISEKNRADVLCAPTAEGWAEAIAKRLTSPRIEVTPSKMVTRANREWLSFHREVSGDLRTLKNRRLPPPRQPKVSVVITNGGYYDERRNSFRSALNQTYANLEILVPSDCGYYSKFSRVRTYDSQLRTPSSIARQASGKYILFLDGGLLHRQTSLSEWVTACESLPSSSNKFLGFSAIVRHGAFGSQQMQSIPLPGELTRALIGHCIANTFTLWNRHSFIEASYEGDADLSHDSALRPFIARALANGFALQTIPLFATLSLSERFLAQSDVENLAPSLSQLSLGRLGPGAEALASSLVSFYSDMVKYRNLFYGRGTKKSARVRSAGKK